MKLHLPKQLFTALLASFTLAAPIATTLSTPARGEEAEATTTTVTWDTNWGITGAPTQANIISDLSTLNQWQDGNKKFYTLNSDHQTTEPTENPDIVVALTSSATDGILVGGYASKRDNNFSFTNSTTIYRDTWIAAKQGTYDGIVGGNVCNNWQWGGAVNFKGDTHIQIDGATVETIIGGNMNDGMEPTFTGNTYITVNSGDVTGSIIGANSNAHNKQSNFTGDTHIYIYDVLNTNSTNTKITNLHAIVGGNARIADNNGPSVLTGNTNITIDLTNYTGSTANFAKKIVGGHHNFTATARISNTSSVSITGHSDVSFIERIVGGNDCNGGAMSVGNVTLNLNNVSTTSQVIGGNYSSNGGSLVASDINLSITGGSYTGTLPTDMVKGHIIGGHYNHTGGVSNLTTASITINIKDNAEIGTLIGGHQLNGTGTSALSSAATGDISITVNGAEAEIANIYGGSYVQRNNANASISQGVITIDLQAGTLTGNVYAGGYQQNATRMVTESTTVKVGSGMTFSGTNQVISGGYSFASEKSGSTVTGDRSLVFTGTAAQDRSGVTFDNFNVIEVTESDANVTLGALTNINGFTKTGAGTLKLTGNQTFSALAVQGGALSIVNGSLSLGSTVTGEGVISTESGGSVNLSGYFLDQFDDVTFGGSGIYQGSGYVTGLTVFANADIYGGSVSIDGSGNYAVTNGAITVDSPAGPYFVNANLEYNPTEMGASALVVSGGNSLTASAESITGKNIYVQENGRLNLANISSETPVTHSLASLANNGTVDIIANNQLHITTTQTHFQGGVITGNGSLHLSMADTWGATGSSYITLAEGSNLSAVYASGVVAYNKNNSSTIETNLRGADLHLLDGADWVIRNGLSGVVDAGIGDIYIDGNVELYVYGGIKGNNAAIIEDDVYVTTGTLTKTDTGDVKLTGKVIANKLVVQNNGILTLTNEQNDITTLQTQNGTTNVSGGNLGNLNTTGGTVNLTEAVTVNSAGSTAYHNGIHSQGGTINVGNDAGTPTTVTTTRVEMGNNNSGSDTLNIKNNATLIVTGGDIGGQGIYNAYWKTGFILSEWKQSTTMNVAGDLLVKNASISHGDKKATINIQNGGVVAAKGLASAMNHDGDIITEGGFNLNVNDGGTLILGERGINLTSNFSSNLGAGTIGISAGEVTISNDLALTSAAGTSFDTQKYSWSESGNAITQGNEGGTLTISGAITGTGAMKKTGAGTLILSGTNTYSGGTTIEAGTLVAASAEALGTGAVNLNAGILQLGQENFTINGSFNYKGGSLEHSGVTIDGMNIIGSTLDNSANTNGTLTLNGTLNVTYPGLLEAVTLEGYAPTYSYTAQDGETVATGNGFASGSFYIIKGGSINADNCTVQLNGKSVDKAVLGTGSGNYASVQGEGIILTLSSNNTGIFYVNSGENELNYNSASSYHVASGAVLEFVDTFAAATQLTTPVTGEGTVRVTIDSSGNHNACVKFGENFNGTVEITDARMTLGGTSLGKDATLKMLKGEIWNGSASTTFANNLHIAAESEENAISIIGNHLILTGVVSGTHLTTSANLTLSNASNNLESLTITGGTTTLLTAGGNYDKIKLTGGTLKLQDAIAIDKSGLERTGGTINLNHAEARITGLTNNSDSTIIGAITGQGVIEISTTTDYADISQHNAGFTGTTYIKAGNFNYNADKFGGGTTLRLAEGVNMQVSGAHTLAAGKTISLDTGEHQIHINSGANFYIDGRVEGDGIFQHQASGTLHIRNNAFVENLKITGSGNTNITGGKINSLTTSNGTVNITGGRIDSLATSNGTVNINGAIELHNEHNHTGGTLFVNAGGVLDMYGRYNASGSNPMVSLVAGSLNLYHTSTTHSMVKLDMSGGRNYSGKLLLHENASLAVTSNFWLGNTSAVTLMEDATLTKDGMTIRGRGESSQITALVNGDEFSKGSSSHHIANADISIENGGTLELKLTNSSVTNTGSDDLTVNNSGNTITNLAATGGNVTLSSNMSVESITAAEGKTVTVAAGKAISMADWATINTIDTSTNATVSSAEINSSGIFGIAGSNNNTTGSMNNTVLDIQNASSFSIKDMLLSSIRIVGGAGSSVSLNNVTANDVSLHSGAFSMTAATTLVNTETDVEEGDYYCYSSSALNGITLNNAEGASLAVDLGDLSCLMPMGPGKYNLSITLSGFTMSYTEGKGLVFAADSWLGKLLGDNVKYTYVASSEDRAALTALPTTGNTDGITVTITQAGVDAIITINGLNVPEPATATLSLLALAALAARRRRK